MAQRNMGTPSTGERFVIGVDFGTTYFPLPPLGLRANAGIASPL